MAAGTRDDPHVLNPEFRYAAAYVMRLIHPDATEDETTTFIRAVSPLIIHSVNEKEYFRFEQNRTVIFQLLKDESGHPYILRDSFNARPVYLYEPESKPTLFDQIDETKNECAASLTSFPPFPH